MSADGNKQRWVLAVCIVVGAILTIIGIRYLVSPYAAARTFGLSESPGRELHTLIGLRNVWVGLLAIGFAAMRQWPALALWFGIGSVVCFADAAVVAASSGKPVQTAFHIGSGVVFLAVALVTWRKARSKL